MVKRILKLQLNEEKHHKFNEYKDILEFIQIAVFGHRAIILAWTRKITCHLIQRHPGYHARGSDQLHDPSSHIFSSPNVLVTTHFNLHWQSRVY